MVALGDVGHDPRIRKTIQWLRQRNHEVVIVNHAQEFVNPTAQILSPPLGKLDLSALHYLWGRHAVSARDAILNNIKREDGSHFAPDIVYCHELEALWLLLAKHTNESSLAMSRGATAEQCRLAFQRLPRVKLVYDAHEFERNRRAYNSPLTFLSNRVYLEESCVPLVDEIIVVSEGIAKEYKTLYGIDAKVIPNCVPMPTRPINIALPGIVGNHPAIIHSGNLTQARCLDMVMAAAIKAKVRFVAVGNVIDAGGAKPMNEIAAGLQKQGAILIPAQPYPYCGVSNSLLDICAGAVAGICITEDTGIRSYELALPNKVYEYAMAGVPIIVSKHMTEAAALIKHYGIGRTFDNTVDDLAEKIRFYKNNPLDPARFVRFNLENNYEARCGPILDEVTND